MNRTLPGMGRRDVLGGHAAAPAGSEDPRRSGVRRRGPPREEPRVVPSTLEPALLVAEDVEPDDEAGKLAVLQEVVRPGTREPLQVGSGRVLEDQQAPRCERA